MRRKKKRVISEEHRAKLRENIAKARAAKTSPACDTNSASKVPITPVLEPVEMEIVKIPINVRVVWAKTHDGKIHTVFVGNNATFAHGDKIRVRPYPGQPGIWDLVGQPPRDRRRVAGGAC